MRGEVAVIRGADEVLGPTPSLAPRMEHAAPDDRDTRRPVRPPSGKEAEHGCKERQIRGKIIWRL